jgi:hypothetical protein
MSEQFLHGAYVGAVFELVRGEPSSFCRETDSRRLPRRGEGATGDRINEWRRMCGVTVLAIPASRAARRTARWMLTSCR